MKTHQAAATIAVSLTLALSSQARSQGNDAGIAQHVEAARQAAGMDFEGVFTRICAEARAPSTPPPAASAAVRAAGAPDRSTWYAEPVKVFDNLYFVGQTEYSAWAVTTSQGIIVIDTLFDYSVQAEVAQGLKKLGLDPTQIKYAIVSHGHGDHSGGAKYLQETFGTKIVLSADVPVPTCSSPTTPSSTAQKQNYRPWRYAKPAIRIRTSSVPIVCSAT